MAHNQTKHTNPFGGGKVISNPFGKSNEENNTDFIPKPKIYETNNVEEKERNPPKKDEIFNKESHSSKSKQIEKSMIKEKDEQQNLKEIMLREYEKIKNFNSNESVMRMNVRTLPSNIEVLKESGITLGLTISPLANSNSIPIIKYKDDEEIPRCVNCKAYINPFLNWSEGGDKWVCNLCKSKNITATYYYETLDKSGQRKDIGSRPEISVGSYEFFATKSFLGENFGKELPSPVYIFAFDVSLASIGTGYLSSCIEGVKQTIIDGFPFDANSKVGIITYDSAIHFYNLSKKLTQPQMIQVNDSKIFLPLPTKFLLGNISECKDLILGTLDSIQNNFKDSIVRDASKLIDAMDAISLLTYKIGGKVLLFHASHSIRDNQNLKNYNNLPQDELIYSSTDNKLFSNKGIGFTENNTSIDFFIAAEQFINIVTLNQICDFTAGNLHFFKKFRIESHYKNLVHRIKKTLTRDQGYECVMRTRFSNSLKIVNFMTPVLISHNDLLRMSSVDEDMSLTFNLEYQTSKITQDKGDKLTTYIKPEESDPFIYLQTAVLYTHRDGTRRVRVHNFCLPTSNRVSDIHDSIDCEAYASFLFKLQIDKVFKSKKMVNSILYSEEIFKTFISSIFSNIQMHSKDLPENIEYLPLYFCGIIKNRVCCKDEIGLKLDIDTSNFIRIKILRMSDNEIINFIYPKFFQIHHLMLDQNLGTKDDEGNVTLPEIVSAHSNSLENDGVYLIDNGYVLILFIKLQASIDLIDKLFGVKSLTEIKSQVQEISITSRENDICLRLTNIIEYLRSSKTFYQNLMIVFETTDSERLVKECLIEDNLCPWIKTDYLSYRQSIINETSSYNNRSLKK